MPGTTIVPPAYTELPLGAARRRRAFTFDLDKAGQLLDAAGYKKGSDGKRTMPDGKPIGTLRLVRAQRLRPASLDTMDFFKEWLGDLGIDSEVTAMDSQQADRRDPRRQLRRLPVGLVRRARPGLDAQLLHLRPARRARRTRGTATRSTTRSTSSSTARSTTPSARPSRQADAADALPRTRPTWSRRTPRSARPSAATGSPASSRSPTRAASGSMQYGAHNYIHAAAGRRGRRLRRRRRRRSAPAPSSAASSDDGGSNTGR